VIVLSCGALGAVVANRAPRPVALLAVAHLVPAGVTVTASDLGTVSVAPVAGLDAMPLQDAGQVIGRRAAEELEPGSLLVPAELAPQRGLPAGVALIGTSLAVDQTPADLARANASSLCCPGRPAWVPAWRPPPRVPPEVRRAGPRCRRQPVHQARSFAAPQ